MSYTRRVIDDELMAGLPALTIEGPKAVGKTETAMRRASTIRRLDDPAEASLAQADPARTVSGDPPVLLDEWQQVPEVWDAVRRSVDEDPAPGRFLLTGSAAPNAPKTHSGAGRIVRLRLRPMSLAERGVGTPTVSLRAVLRGTVGALEGDTPVALEDYAEEIVASGFPAIRTLAGRARRAQLDGYIARVVDRDFEEADQTLRRPDTLRRWMTAYAAASSTTASLESIRDAAYREVLSRLWLLDPVSAWTPSRNYFSRLARPEKHQLADPALAARLLGVGVDALLGPSLRGAGHTIGPGLRAGGRGRRPASENEGWTAGGGPHRGSSGRTGAGCGGQDGQRRVRPRRAAPALDEEAARPRPRGRDHRHDRQACVSPARRDRGGPRGSTGAVEGGRRAILFTARSTS